MFLDLIRLPNNYKLIEQSDYSDRLLLLRYQDIDNAWQSSRSFRCDRGWICEARRVSVAFLTGGIETVSWWAEHVWNESVLTHPETVATSIEIGQIYFRAAKWTFRFFGMKEKCWGFWVTNNHLSALEILTHNFLKIKIVRGCYLTTKELPAGSKRDTRLHSSFSVLFQSVIPRKVKIATPNVSFIYLIATTTTFTHFGLVMFWGTRSLVRNLEGKVESCRNCQQVRPEKGKQTTKVYGILSHNLNVKIRVRSSKCLESN